MRGILCKNTSARSKALFAAWLSTALIQLTRRLSSAGWVWPASYSASRTDKPFACSHVHQRNTNIRGYYSETTTLLMRNLPLLESYVGKVQLCTAKLLRQGSDCR